MGSGASRHLTIGFVSRSKPQTNKIYGGRYQVTIRKLTVVLPLIVFGIFFSSIKFSSSDKVESRVHAQGSGGEGDTCDDIDPCKIWGIDTNGSQIVRIDVCSKTITHSTYNPFGLIMTTIAADHGANSLRVGQLSGNVFEYPISYFPNWPQNLTVVDNLSPLSTAFTEGGAGKYFAGNLNALHDPSVLIGNGIGSYSNNESDLVYDSTTDAPWPLIGYVRTTASSTLPNGSVLPADWYLTRVSRNSGTQRFFRPAFSQVEGLAIDGQNRLFASATIASGRIYKIDGWGFPTSSGSGTTWQPTWGAWMIPGFNLVDLASTPRCAGGDEPNVRGDLGDSPASDNSLGITMYAYPGVTANFPTVFDAPNGAIGPLHRDGGFDTSLGSGVSGEFDADKLPDDDGVLNIDPTNGNSNQDHYDDGVSFPLSLPDCQVTSINYEVTVGTSDEILRYSNAWIDFNQDGDWNDTGSCIDPAQWAPGIRS